MMTLQPISRSSEFETRRNRTRSNFIVNIQQGDWPPVKGVKTVAILKERVIMPSTESKT